MQQETQQSQKQISKMNKLKKYEFPAYKYSETWEKGREKKELYVLIKSK